MKKNLLDKEIIGNGLLLRPINWESITEDVQKILKWTVDKDVQESLKFFSFFQNKITTGRQLKYFTRMIESPVDQIFIVETIEGEFLGTCGLHDIDLVNNNLRVGIIIFNKNCWRQGYGKRILKLLLRFVFDELKIKIVYLTARVDNELAIHIYTKLGFKAEGINRQVYRVKNDQYMDLLRMSILRDEWQAQRVVDIFLD